jgi:ribosome-associated protein
VSDLEVTPHLVIPDAELVWRFGPSSGPGGQHANRSNTRAELTFDIARSEVLGDSQRRRLLERFGPVLTVGVDDERSQARNRDLARLRMADRLADALRVARPRRPTRPSRSSARRRVDAKRRRSQLKDQRRRPSSDD